MAEQPRQPAESEPRVRRRRPTVADSPAGEVLVTDLRKSGWSWGWDTLAREFAGVLHQSGVGLYFTYATYTDNRKESPYRGSSYTGVEALADFSGESADDIRTINKILAALGLARFETYTVYMPSKDGRRATRNRLHCYLLERDPHLTTEDVLAVLRLALNDQKVYKYIRHIFRPAFRPIDRIADATGTPREHPNPWYAILPAVKRTTEWRTLALRAERDHLSLRERNIHGVEAAARRRQRDDSDPSTIPPATEDGADTILPNTEDAGMVVNTEDATPPTLPETEDGRGGCLPGTDGKHDQDPIKQDGTSATSTKPGSTTTTRVRGSGQPQNTRDQDTSTKNPTDEDVFALFGQANGRDVTPIERDLLRQIIADFDGPARQHSPDHSGAVWVIAAIIEAVDAGSRFVSPKRIRLICQRWGRDGFQAPGPPPRGSNGASDRLPWLDVPDVSMPNGQSSRTIWRRVLGIARGSLSADVLIRVLEPCYIASYDEWRREITIAVPDERTVEKLHRTYRYTLERAFAMIFGKTMRFQCVIPSAECLSDVRSATEDEAEDEAVEEQVTEEEAAPAHADRTVLIDDEGDLASLDQMEEDAEGNAARETVPGQASPPTGGFRDSLREGMNSNGEMEPPLSVVADMAAVTLGHDATNQQLWSLVLDHCRDDVSVLRRHLFETQAVLARREGRDFVVVAANTFIADQLELCAPQLEAALRTVLGEDDVRVRCRLRQAEREDV
jgi:hypothetical protein